MLNIPLYVVVFPWLVIPANSIQENRLHASNQEDFDNTTTLPIIDEPEESPWLNTNVTGAEKLFEGDIDLGRHHISEYTVGTRKTIEGVQYNAVRSPLKWWKNQTVPFRLSPIFDLVEKITIAEAMVHIEYWTCIKFKARTVERDFVNIIRHQSGGCFSRIGRVGGRQNLSLARGCMSMGTIVHELVHALGFFHEQSRNDRDDYVEILWDNIMDNRMSNFQNYSLKRITHLNTEYDYWSLMHYAAKDFSKNGKPTIKVLHGNVKIGQNRGLSVNDALKINRLYECPPKKVTKSKPGPRTKPTPRPKVPQNTTLKPKLKTIERTKPTSNPNPTSILKLITNSTQETTPKSNVSQKPESKTNRTKKPEPKPDSTKMPNPMIVSPAQKPTANPNPYSTTSPAKLINYTCEKDTDSVNEICPLLERSGYCKNKAIYKLCPRSCSSSLSCKWKAMMGACTSLKRSKYMFKHCGCACFEYLKI